MSACDLYRNILFRWNANWEEISFVRIACILLTVIGATMGCDGQDSCIRVGADEEFGTNHLEKVELVSNYARELGLPTTTHEVAAIVGAAYAASQLDGGQSGIPVKICLRSGQGDDTEFRVLSTRGKPLIEWQSTMKYRAP